MINSLWRTATPRFASASASIGTTDADDGVVRISLHALLALRHAAQSVPLKPGRIRAPGSGAYQSVFKGRGMEFDEVRPYTPGDDAHTLDWRVMARTGRPHTKLFREERERAVILWIDLRSSMFFATQGAFKAVRAAQAAALLAWSAAHQGDRLGALIFSEDVHTELRPRRGKAPLLHVLRQLAEHPVWQSHIPANDSRASAGALNQSLSRLRRVVQPGSLVILLSDFADLDDQGSAHLIQLARHSELIVADIHDPLEAELPPPGIYRVSDGNSNLAMETSERNMRERYRQRFMQRQAEMQQLCQRHSMVLLRISTHEEPLTALQRGLVRI
ncbi:MAG TPA: DUF58 domain-containing protein [Rhodocyclaceae bacterium]|nr:DUF58 domain-containing protein [Rhodocyclaceae bacterium]